MKNEYLDIELIERFQEGKLTEEERQMFHQRLLEDEAFAKTVQLQLNITEEIDTFWTNDLITKMEEWEQKEKRKSAITTTPIEASETISTQEQPIENAQKTTSNKHKIWKWFGIGILVVLILVAVGWYLFQPKEQIDLFATHFEPYEDIIVNHSAEDSDLLTLAMGAYSEEQYAVAMFTLKRFLNEVDSISSENRTAAEFYLAISNLGTGNVNTARQQLETIANDNNNRFQQQADWYIALANIKAHHLEKAKIQLEKIQSNSNHSYQKQANKLLQSLL